MQFQILGRSRIGGSATYSKGMRIGRFGGSVEIEGNKIDSKL